MATLPAQGPAVWTDRSDNWRKLDGDWLQYRAILRYASPPATPDGPGQVIYDETATDLRLWNGTVWRNILASDVLKLATSGVDATLGHTGASGNGLTFTSTKINSSVPFSGPTDAATLTSTGLTIKTGAAFASAALSTNATDLSVNVPVSATGFKTTGTISAASIAATGAISGASLTTSAGATIGGALGVSGAVTLTAPGTAAASAARRDYVDTKVATSGDTMTGALSGIAPTSAAHLTRKDYVDGQIATRFPTTGGTITGVVVLNSAGDQALVARGTSPYLDFQNDAGSVQYGYLRGYTDRMALVSKGDLRLQAAGNDLHFYTNDTLRGMITGTAFLYGKAASDLTNAGVEMYSSPSSGEGAVRSTVALAGNSNFYARHEGASNATGQPFMQFMGKNGATSVLLSHITQDGVIGIKIPNVTVSAPSDYRLKNDLGPVVDAVERFKLLKVRYLGWKDGHAPNFDGFFAHEVADVVPSAVSGEKDEVFTEDDDAAGIKAGDIKTQQLSKQELIPLMSATLLELIGRVESLEAA